VTAALLALALLAAGLGSALIALGWRHLSHVEGRAREHAAWAEQMRTVIAERDAARASLAQTAAELELQTALNRTLADDLADARKESTRARIREVTDASDHDRGPAVDRVLAERVLADAERSARDHRSAQAAAVSGPGAASAGPVPAWAGLASDGG
jgi:hypothetical protein